MYKESWMSSKRAVPAFIQKLWSLLQNYSTHEDVLCWTESERSFAIVDQRKFCENLLPIYFKHSNLTSFVRQLNMYNFHKVKNSQFQNQFEHQLFRKGHKQLLYGIKRKPTESDLNFGKQLIESLTLNNVHEPHFPSPSAELAVAPNEIKMHGNFNDGRLGVEEVSTKNSNLKHKNTELRRQLASLRAQSSASLRKVKSLFQVCSTFQLPIHSSNFKISQFMKHLQSQEDSMGSSAQYLQFFSQPVPPLLPQSICWGAPFVLPPTPSYYFS